MNYKFPDPMLAGPFQTAPPQPSADIRIRIQPDRDFHHPPLPSNYYSLAGIPNQHSPPSVQCPPLSHFPTSHYDVDVAVGAGASSTGLPLAPPSTQYSNYCSIPPHPPFPLEEAASFSYDTLQHMPPYSSAFRPLGLGATRPMGLQHQGPHPVYHQRKRPREAESEAIVYSAPAKQPADYRCRVSPTHPDSANSRVQLRGPKLIPYPPEPQNGVQVTLLKSDMWRMFYMADTEMIVTKPGRCLFPQLAFNIQGLSLRTEYDISVRAVLSDRRRFKYIKKEWSAQEGSPESACKEEKIICKHQSSPMTGSQWMDNDVSFKTLKITHNEKSKKGDILLRTMYKYYFQLLIEEHDSDSEPLVFSFPLTTFVAVTAYQSPRITVLKRDNNPFAKGVKRADRQTTDFPLSAPASFFE